VEVRHHKIYPQLDTSYLFYVKDSCFLRTKGEEQLAFMPKWSRNFIFLAPTCLQFWFPENTDCWENGQTLFKQLLCHL